MRIYVVSALFEDQLQPEIMNNGGRGLNKTMGGHETGRVISVVSFLFEDQVQPEIMNNGGEMTELDNGRTE